MAKKKRASIARVLVEAVSDIANAASVAATGSEIGVLELAAEDELKPPQTKRARLDRRNRRKAYSSSDKRRYNDRCIKRLSLLWFARKTNLPPTCTT